MLRVVRDRQPGLPPVRGLPDLAGELRYVDPGHRRGQRPGVRGEQHIAALQWTRRCTRISHSSSRRSSPSSCNFSGCHDSATDSGKLDLRPGVSHDHLVGVSSQMTGRACSSYPTTSPASYLMLMLRDVAPAVANPPAGPPPGNIGFMRRTPAPRALCAVKSSMRLNVGSTPVLQTTDPCRKPFHQHK